MLEHDASYGGSRLAMALVLNHKRDAITAWQECQEARRYWSRADRDMRELKQLALEETASRPR